MQSSSLSGRLGIHTVALQLRDEGFCRLELLTMENFNTYTVKLIFLILPGLIGIAFFRALRGRRNRQNWELFVHVITLAFVSYFLIGFLYRILGISPDGLKSSAASIAPIQAIFEAFISKSEPLDWGVIVWTSMTACLIVVLLSFIDTHKWLQRPFRRFGITNYSGESELWEYFFNARPHGTEAKCWVLVRDHRTGLAYLGWVRAFSDPERKRELILQEVEVYTNDTATYCYSTPVMYFARQRDDLTIEIPLENGNGIQVSNMIIENAGHVIINKVNGAVGDSVESHEKST